MIHNKYLEIIREFLRGYNREVYGRQLVNRVKMSPKNIALTLDELENKGVLSSKKSGNRKHFHLNFLNPLIEDYIILFEKFRKIEFLENQKRLIDFVKILDGEIVCVFGSYAKGNFDKNSDLDILIVGKVDSSNAKKIGKDFGYNVQVFNLSLLDFKKQISKKTTLILEILDNHVLIKGADKFVREVLNA